MVFRQAAAKKAERCTQKIGEIGVIFIWNFCYQESAQ
jgi:hypothetical protein